MFTNLDDRSKSRVSRVCPEGNEIIGWTGKSMSDPWKFKWNDAKQKLRKLYLVICTTIRRHLRGLSDCLTYLDHGSRQNDLNDTANDDKCEDNQSTFFLLGVHHFIFLCHEVFSICTIIPGNISEMGNPQYV